MLCRMLVSETKVLFAYNIIFPIRNVIVHSFFENLREEGEIDIGL